jgi:AcrR family transcriptional regulator
MDPDERYIPRSGPMFNARSLAKAEMATDLAIPLLADGGWPAVTLRTVAAAANVTPQAIAAWFPSVTAMRRAIAERYGNRWVDERRAVASRRLIRTARPAYVDSARSQVALALLPGTWLEEVFDGVWLTVAEAGRWDEVIGLVVASIQERERDVVAELLEEQLCDSPSFPDGMGEQRFEQHVDIVLALVRGLRVARTASHGRMEADRAAVVLEGGLSGGT